MLPVIRADGSTILVSPTTDNDFRQAVAPSLEVFSNDVDITYEFVTGEDSSNILFDNWVGLVKRIEQAESEGYQGVAITHGTNTLAHTATALALALNGINPKQRACCLPVCISGAQNTIYVPGGDGRINLENIFRTLIAAIKCGGSDVLVNFHDWVMLGSRTIKVHESSFRAMDSPAQPQHVGIIDRRGVILYEHLLNTKPIRGGHTAPAWSDQVLVLKADVGLNPKHIESILKLGQFKALIIESFGAGSVCTKGDYNLLPLINTITNKMKIPVFISSQFPGGSVGTSQDEIAVQTMEAGAIPCFDTTDIATSVKIRWALANDLCKTIDDFRTLMRTDYAGEVTALA